MQIRTDEEAKRWLEATGGRLHRRSRPDGPTQWAVVLRTPTARPGQARLILAFGDSLPDAVEAARAGWEAVWSDLPRS